MFATVLAAGAPTVVAQPTANPILFVTQVPIRPDFATIGSTFANHRSDVGSAARGGDLWIRYGDGSIENLTAAAGFGSSDPDGFQGVDAIAVRDPAMHWDGTKAIFSMVVGGASRQYEVLTHVWQLYEITGLGSTETPVITRVANQPDAFNNVMPAYGTDDRILFISDRTRAGESHLYPQLDEYERTPTNTGLWSLDPSSGELRLLNHAPSGDFHPIIDSFGRVVFTQWDHLQRDQLADGDAHLGTGQGCDGGTNYGSVTFSSEAVEASFSTDLTEDFPEPRSCRTDLLAGTGLYGVRFNHFFPWTIREDGTEGEVLNHLGRHELHHYLAAARTDDANVVEYYGQYPRVNPNAIENFFHIAEDPMVPGRYLGIEAPEFQTHSAGQLVVINAPPNLAAEDVVVEYLTHPDTSGVGATPNHSGHYREPLPLADGQLVAVHTAETRAEATSGGPHDSRYDFRLKLLGSGPDGYLRADVVLTSGITKSIAYWTPDVFVEFSGTLWELNPVEVRPRPRPVVEPLALPSPEQAMFDAAGVALAELRAYLEANELALVVSRDVTARDDLDLQQPVNLRVPDGVESISLPGRVYDVEYMQFFQADSLRAAVRPSSGVLRPGRRILPRVLHDPVAIAANPPVSGPPGSVVLGRDGSMAAFVPARRALTWQLTDPVGEGVVRERYWLTFQPGEVRVCANCHGLSDTDQLDRATPVNAPQALFDLLQFWKDGPQPVCEDAAPLERGRLTMRGSRFQVRFSGQAVIPKPWIGVDPPANGVRFVIPGAVDATVPGGLRGGESRSGWSVNRVGNRWTYRDNAGIHGGVTKVVLRDLSARRDGLLSWTIQVRGADRILPAPGAVETAIVFGADGECASRRWSEPGACAARTNRLLCR